MAVRALCVFVLALLLPLHARAEGGLTDAQRAQMESLRGEIAAGIQLQAYDLLDELVYGWVERPVFPGETPLVLADVSVPVGFGSGMKALVENHLAGLIINNPRARVVLVHCTRCSSVVVHSGAKGTVLSRGVDDPATLTEAGSASGSRHALFVDFEAEGSSLVLRARITRLEPSLPIVYAKTLSSSTAAPALLRSGERLKSAAEARQEYEDALRGRGWYVLPLRLGVRSYAGTDAPVAPQPFPWLQLGIEGALTQARAWTASFGVGVSWTPESHTGWMVQARIARLLSGSATSLTSPDFYLFGGVTLINVSGSGSAVFRSRVPTLESLLTRANRSDPQERFAAFPLGLELRVKNRIGVSVFLESIPALTDAEAIGTYVDLGIVAFQSWGAEVSFCF